ncbi:MAG: hypothetical protein EOL93_01740 [Epsilonproteobacteria bacterium]|nr:hypothetical protein [Campylobacterota bacterium]
MSQIDCSQTAAELITEMFVGDVGYEHSLIYNKYGIEVRKASFVLDKPELCMKMELVDRNVDKYGSGFIIGVFESGSGVDGIRLDFRSMIQDSQCVLELTEISRVEVYFDEKIGHWECPGKYYNYNESDDLDVAIHTSLTTACTSM